MWICALIQALREPCENVLSLGIKVVGRVLVETFNWDGRVFGDAGMVLGEGELESGFAGCFSVCGWDVNGAWAVGGGICGAEEFDGFMEKDRGTLELKDGCEGEAGLLSLLSAFLVDPRDF